MKKSLYDRLYKPVTVTHRICRMCKKARLPSDRYFHCRRCTDSRDYYCSEGHGEYTPEDWGYAFYKRGTTG
jgi:hypothetical protein